MVPARPRVLKPDAYLQVRSHLLGGTVRPGQRLSHRALAKDLGLSRSPVREALLALEAEGLIEHRPQSGAYLREVSPRELEELYDMREVIEPYAASRAAAAADAPQRARLRRSCADFAAIAARADLAAWLTAAENRQRLSALDREFHATILEASGNRLAHRFFEAAQVLALVVSWNFSTADPATLAARTRLSARQHCAICAAVLGRDPARAARAMRGHVSGMKRLVLGAGAA